MYEFNTSLGCYIFCVSVFGHANISSPLLCLLSKITETLLLTMSRITSSTAELVEKAVGYMQKHPTLRTSLAMKRAGFSEEDQANPSKQRLVQRHLPGKAKRKMQAQLSSNSSNMGSIIGKTVPGGGFVKYSLSPSPVTNFSNPTESDDAAAAASLEDSPPAKRFRLTSRQMQEKRAQELKKRELLKKVHKWATSLFAEGGKSARECHELAKKRFKGVAPSKTTIHHYVGKSNGFGCRQHSTWASADKEEDGFYPNCS